MKPSLQIEEIQGIYGPFTFSETLLQKIWWRREFDTSALATLGGERVEVLEPGRWNLLGGPDFKDSRLRIGGREVRGEVELHLHARDWGQHGHNKDEAYDRVVLHVVLFPPSAEVMVTRGAQQREIPVLVLLPWLHHDLEEYAAEAAMENLAGRPASQMRQWLDGLPLNKAAGELALRASRRWRGKVHFSRVRFQRLGWTAACHHTALEVLGYRFNRTPMLQVAARWPLPAWTGEAVSSTALEENGMTWVRVGMRPVNRPEKRLAQYASWVRAVPDWPQRWAQLAAELSRSKAACADTEAGPARRAAKLAIWRRRIGDEVCGGFLNGPRLDTFICDGLLPLWAARSGDDLGDIWRVWYPGDQPAKLSGHLQRMGIIDGRERPASHGAFQGLLDWLIERAES